MLTKKIMKKINFFGIFDYTNVPFLLYLYIRNKKEIDMKTIKNISGCAVLVTEGSGQVQVAELWVQNTQKQEPKVYTNEYPIIRTEISVDITIWANDSFNHMSKLIQYWDTINNGMVYDLVLDN